MAVSTGNYLKGFYTKTRAMGDKAINSDMAFEIEGFESHWLLAKQAPWAELSTAGEIEVPTPLGAALWQPQQAKVNQQGSITLMETVAGDIDDLLLNILTNQGLFNATIYEGVPTNYIRKKKYYDCFIQMDPIDRDWENRSQILIFTGTLFYHYFGDIEKGSADGNMLRQKGGNVY